MTKLRMHGAMQVPASVTAGSLRQLGAQSSSRKRCRCAAMQLLPSTIALAVWLARAYTCMWCQFQGQSSGCNPGCSWQT